jgi:hypothetical protein
LLVGKLKGSTTEDLLAGPEMGGKLELGSGRVVIDGKEGPEYADVTPPVFSSDSSRVAFLAKKGQMWTSVLDGHEGRRLYPGAATPTFSPGGGRLAFAARDEAGQQFVVLDGEECGKYDSIATLPVFDPTGRWLAYGATRGKSAFLVINGEELGRFDRFLSGPAFQGSTLFAVAMREAEALRIEVQIPGPTSGPPSFRPTDKGAPTPPARPLKK